ncbi:MAG: hypothetical protein MJE77_31215 [Proteobacteria bacterium]|nr:hypothetical protein [Pseudomonadota bacterium]
MDPRRRLTVVSFLQRISEAIWAAHNRAKNHQLHQAYIAECPNIIPFSYGPPDEDDDIDMPF